MRFLITGVCGFVGSSLAVWLKLNWEGEKVEIIGIDNLSRRGSETNWDRLASLGIDLRHGDIRSASDLDTLPPVDWVIDAAANPSVMAGVSGSHSSRNVTEHNLFGTVQVLEYCKRIRAGLILLSTSRVYSIKDLIEIPLERREHRFCLATGSKSDDLPLRGKVSDRGISEDFPTCGPISLYGATKLCSEVLAVEYSEAFGLPVWINRCGVMSGAGQFGKSDQGIVAFWIDSWRRKQTLSYIGFEGSGAQVRDVLHPDDLAKLVMMQIKDPNRAVPRVIHCAGGSQNSFSLAELSDWCTQMIGHPTAPIRKDLTGRLYDVPWLILDNRSAEEFWNWKPTRSVASIFQEVLESQERQNRSR